MFKLIFFLFLTCSSLLGLSFSKEYKVEALNKGDAHSMTFKPMFLKASVGDVVTFIPTSKGHTSESVFTPKGATTWKSKTSKEVKVTLNKEGLYIYKCRNHGIMGMAGVIQVGASASGDGGRPTNFIEAKKFYNKLKKKFIMNKNRLDKFFE